MITAMDKETLVNGAIALFLTLLWYILTWYREKSGQDGRRR